MKYLCPKKLFSKIFDAIIVDMNSNTSKICNDDIYQENNQEDDFSLRLGYIRFRN